MSNVIIDKVAEAMEERRRTAAADWAGLVESISRGKEIAAAKVEDILRRADKSLEDLRAAVGVRERRTQLRAVFDKLPEHQKEAAEVDRLIAQENRKLEEAQQRHADATAPLVDRAHAANVAIAQAQAAQDELINACPNEQVIRELAQAEQSLALLIRSKSLLEATAESRSEGMNELAAAKRQLEEERATQFRTSGEAKIKAAADAEARLPEVRKQIKELQGKVESLREKRLAP